MKHCDVFKFIKKMLSLFYNVDIGLVKDLVSVSTEKKVLVLHSLCEKSIGGIGASLV